MIKRVYCSLKPAISLGDWDDTTGVSGKLFRTIPDAIAALQACDQDQIADIVDFHYRFGKVVLTVPASKNLIQDEIAGKTIRDLMVGMLEDLFDGKIDATDPILYFKQYCENSDK